jgi:hypothetical protein
MAACERGSFIRCQTAVCIGAVARRTVAGRSWAAVFDALLADYAAFGRGQSSRTAA